MVYMCPEHQILSLYLDGELPSPWKEQMEAHLGECPRCAARLASYRRLGNAVAPPLPPGLVENARERVWRAVGALAENPAPRREPSLWRRSVAVPLPALAAAAAALLIALGLAFTGAPPADAPDAVMAAGINLDVRDMVPASDITGVLQYLGDDSADIVIIRLPESRNFRSAGEPTILKAADYSRRRTAQ
jgi:anti-sigma factor RsiW